MQLARLRQLVALAIVLLLTHQAGLWIAAFFGSVWGGLTGVVLAVAAIYGLYLSRHADVPPAAILVPVALLLVLPLIASVWTALSDPQATWFDRVVAVTPLLVGFVAPVGLLIVVYAALRRKTIERKTLPGGAHLP